MIKQPLFGQDSSPHVTSMFISAIATLVCWIIFCILCVVIKFKPKLPEYQEIQIVLDSTPVVEQPVEEQSVSAEQQSAVAEPVETKAPELPNPVETPVAAAKVEAPKAQPSAAKPKAETQPKTQTTTKTTDPSKKVDFDNIQYATDYSDFDFNNVSSNKKTSTSVPEWFFGDDTDGTDSQPDVSKSNPTVLEKSGFSQNSAAEGATEGNQGLSSKDNQRKTDNPTVSDETREMLARIAKATAYKTKTGNTESTTIFETSKDSSGSVNIKMSDGSIRKLLKPKEPKIELSQEAANSIKDTTTVTITFQVNESGNVFGINISNIATISDIIKDEITAQLKNWVFEPFSSLATATFDFTIKKQ